MYNDSSKFSMNFALDWDGTVTSEPLGFLEFIKTMRSRGHKVYIVTMRYPSECELIPEEFKNEVDGIIPTSRMAKLKHVKELGLNIHIWIDDTPRAILEDAANVWGTSTPEGQVVSENNNITADVK